MKQDVIDYITEAVLEHVGEIEPLFDLPGVIVEHKFLDTHMDDDSECAAQTFVRWPYRDAQIVWYVPVIVHMQGTEELRHIVFHEYAHVLLAPLDGRLKSSSEQFEECAAENIARAMIAAYAAAPSAD